MSKGKRISEEVRAHIYEMAYLNPKWSTWELTQHVTADFKDRRLFIPGPDSFRKIAKEARTPGSEDVPWSIGSVSPAFVPPDALEDVLKVWTWTKLGSVGFTVRQAKWAARLRLLSRLRDSGILSFDQNLYEWATRYAIREKAAEVRKPPLPLDTTDLDAALAFPREVYLALEETGLVVRLPYQYDLELLDEGAKFGLMPEWFRDGEALDGEDLEGPASLDFRWKLTELKNSIPVDARDIGSIWLQAMAAASGWRQLPIQRRMDVILEVYGQVIASKKDVFRPSEEILAEVGYED